MNCSTCGKETKNPKYCSRSCAATTNNSKYRKREKEGRCFTCKVPIHTKFKYCDVCFHNYIRYQLPPKKRLDICTICKCNKNETNSRKAGGKRVGPQSYCKECTAGTLLLYNRRVKQQCVDYRGGQCSICGYNQCNSALDFHHRNPQDKTYAISNLANRKFDDDLKKELDKCDLLCANCHRELHSKEKDEKYKEFIILYEKHKSGGTPTCTETYDL